MSSLFTLSAGPMLAMPWFSIIVGVGSAGIHQFVNSPLSSQVIAAMPVTADKVPWFVCAFLPFWAWLLGIITITAITFLRKGGYDNVNPRAL